MPEKAHRLQLNRASFEEAETALESGAHAVDEFLAQFEGDTRLKAVLGIAVTLASAAKAATDELDQSPRFYALEIADLDVAPQLAEAQEQLQWIVDVAEASAFVYKPEAQKS